MGWAGNEIPFFGPSLMELQLVGKLGHPQLESTLKYINCKCCGGSRHDSLRATGQLSCRLGAGKSFMASQLVLSVGIKGEKKLAM